MDASGIEHLSEKGTCLRELKASKQFISNYKNKLESFFEFERDSTIQSEIEFLQGVLEGISNTIIIHSYELIYRYGEIDSEKKKSLKQGFLRFLKSIISRIDGKINTISYQIKIFILNGLKPDLVESSPRLSFFRIRNSCLSDDDVDVLKSWLVVNILGCFRIIQTLNKYINENRYKGVGG